MKSDWLVLVILSIPPSLGMICAFFAAKKEGESTKQSGSLIYGHMAGSLACFFSAVLLFVGALLLEKEKIESFYMIIIYFSFFTFIATVLVGIILFIPCALFGFNIGARKRAETDIARNQQQVLEDIQRKSSK